MRPIATLALIALVLVVSLPSLLTSSFAQIAPAITTTASRPPVFLPVVIRAQSTSTPTLTTTPSATATGSPTSQAATATPGSTSTQPVGATSTPSLSPPSFNSCQADPNPDAAPNYPIDIVAIDKSAETVTLRNVTTSDTINLSGWTMCSILGNQQHPISGSLAPGEQRIFSGPSSPIWNNSQRDDGALYTPSGQLVSYFADQ